MTRPSRESLGLRAFATKVNDCVISGDFNGGVLEGWIQLGREMDSIPERAVFGNMTHLYNALSRVVMGCGPDPSRFPLLTSAALGCDVWTLGSASTAFSLPTYPHLSHCH